MAQKVDPVRIVCGQRNDLPGVAPLTQQLGCFVAAHERHLDVHEDDVERIVVAARARAASTAGFPSFTAVISAPLFLRMPTTRTWFVGLSSASRIRQACNGGCSGVSVRSEESAAVQPHGLRCQRIKADQPSEADRDHLRAMGRRESRSRNAPWGGHMTIGWKTGLGLSVPLGRIPDRRMLGQTPAGCFGTPSRSLTP